MWLERLEMRTKLSCKMTHFKKNEIVTTGCLTTERSKVEAFYAHLGWNLLVFQTLYSKITAPVPMKF